MAEEAKKSDQAAPAQPSMLAAKQAAGQPAVQPTQAAGQAEQTPQKATDVQSAQSSKQPANPPESYNLNGSDAAKGKPSFLEKLVNNGKSSNIFTQISAAGNKINSGQALPTSIPGFSLASLIGPKPKFSARAFEEAEAKHRKTAKTIFQFALLVAVAVYGFFYSRLNPNFTWTGPNAAVRFESANNELQKTQTDLNLLKYRMARLWLDDVNGNIDAYQKKPSPELKTKIKKSLTEAQKILSQPFGEDIVSLYPITPEEREQFYEALLKEKLIQQKAALAGNEKADKGEFMLVDNVLRLIENKQFIKTVVVADFEKMSDEEFGLLLQRIREEGTDELSAIDKIRKQRLDWASVIEDIHNVTRQADMYYGQGLFKTVGGFMFSNYKFDSEQGRITISGVTKTSDSKTFSFIAKLLESIEKSPKFKDIDFRSFSKSKDETGDFSSSVNLDFSIQKGFDARDEILTSSSL